MIETIYKEHLRFHSVLVLLKESHGLLYQTLFVDQGGLCKWRDLCHRHCSVVSIRAWLVEWLFLNPHW